MRLVVLTITASLLASPAGSQSLPDCDAAQADMGKAVETVLTSVNQVLAQSATFRGIMQRKAEDRKEDLKFFCRRETFARYDAAAAALDDGTVRAHALRRACRTSDQQARARQAISRFAAMRADHDRMRLRVRSVCAAPGAALL